MTDDNKPKFWLGIESLGVEHFRCVSASKRDLGPHKTMSVARYDDGTIGILDGAAWKMVGLDRDEVRDLVAALKEWGMVE